MGPVPQNPQDSLAYSNASSSVVVEALCQEILASGVDLDIHSGDDMLRFFLYSQGQDLEVAAARYFESGRRIWDTARQIIEWRFGSTRWGGRVLDLGSGYGRVTRHMVRDLVPGSLWVADVCAEAVAFQAQHFGVHGLLSATDPDRFECDVVFDCVFASSLMTHLPAPRFVGWLRRLGALLSRNALLLFSVHDLSLRSRHDQGDDPAGIIFEPISESATLDGTDYGTSWVREAWVRSAVEQALGQRDVRRLPRGLANLQDLYVVLMGDPPGVDRFGLSSLVVERHADGFLEQCVRTAGDRLRLVGWAADRVTGLPPGELRIRIDDVLVATCRDLPLRPAAPGTFGSEQVTVVTWDVAVDLPRTADPARARLSLRPVSSTGEELGLYSGSIGQALRQSELLSRAVALRSSHPYPA